MLPKLYLVLLVIPIACKNHNQQSLSEEMRVVDSLDSVRNAPNIPFYDFDKYSYFLRLWCKGKPSSSATGFFVRRKDKIVLVSNYHVFASVNTATKQLNPDSLTAVSTPIRQTV